MQFFSYRSRMFNKLLDDEPKNLISLEGRELKNGCTILLRGGNGEELARVKRVIKRVLLAKLHCKYERSFLLHQDVQREKFPEMQRFKFDEMTLSPFVNINNFSEDSGSEDGAECGEDENVDVDFDARSSLDKDSAPANRIDLSFSPICDFENYVFTSGMEDIKSRLSNILKLFPF